MFRADVRIVSETHTAADITQVLGVRPDDTRAVGDARFSWSPPAGVHTWVRHVNSGESCPRFEDLAEGIQGWGADLAHKLGTLSRQGLEVQLSVVQDIADPNDPMEKGITMSAALIQWLAEAGASVDIDQYIDC